MSEPLSPREAAALAALMSHDTIAAAAEAAEVDERTVRRYLERPDFKAALREAQMAVVAHSTSALAGACSEAVEALKSVMDADLASTWTPGSPACGQSDRHHADTEIAVADSEVGAMRTAGSPPCGHPERSCGQPGRRLVDTGIGCEDSRIAA